MWCDADPLQRRGQTGPGGKYVDSNPIPIRRENYAHHGSIIINLKWAYFWLKLGFFSLLKRNLQTSYFFSVFNFGFGYWVLPKPMPHFKQLLINLNSILNLVVCWALSKPINNCWVVNTYFYLVSKLETFLIFKARTLLGFEPIWISKSWTPGELELVPYRLVPI